MKLSIFIMVLVAAFTTTVRADENANYTLKSRIVYETFTSKVIKVLSFVDGDSEYDAYVVNWKDHEVVVASNIMGITQAKYKVGDVVTCNMEQRSVQVVGGTMRAQLSFTLGRGMASFGGQLEGNPVRLQAIADEVSRRRADREAAAAKAVTEASR